MPWMEYSSGKAAKVSEGVGIVFVYWLLSKREVNFSLESIKCLKYKLCLSTIEDDGKVIAGVVNLNNDSFRAIFDL